jgi:hypothetical protein
VQLDVAIAFADRLLHARRHLLRVAVLQQAGIGRQPIAPRTAQQAIERQVRGLARDVPQRDVESRQSEDREAVAAEQMELLLQVVGEARDVACVLADGDRRHHVVQRRGDGVAAAVAEGLAPADDAGVGLDPHQQDVVGRPVAAAIARRVAAEGERHLDRVAVYARDLHATLPVRLISARSFSAC